MPLGLADRRIPNPLITASSYHSFYCGPWNARLHQRRVSRLGGSWCARTNNQKQYLQVSDLITCLEHNWVKVVCLLRIIAMQTWRRHESISAEFLWYAHALWNIRCFSTFTQRFFKTKIMTMCLSIHLVNIKANFCLSNQPKMQSEISSHVIVLCYLQCPLIIQTGWFWGFGTTYWCCYPRQTWRRPMGQELQNHIQQGWF